MSGKIQHDPGAFILALASAHKGERVRELHWAEREQWERVARCAVEHLARDAAASAAAGASETAQAAIGRVIERICDLLTPDQMRKMTEIVRDMKAGR